MKKLMITMLMFAMASQADVTLQNATIKTQVVISTNTTTVAAAKVIWTGFSINYVPPAYTQAVYTVTYVVRDMATGRDILGSRATRVMKESEVVAFAATKGLNFGEFGQGIGYLLNEYLKTLFDTKNK